MSLPMLDASLDDVKDSQSETKAPSNRFIARFKTHRPALLGLALLTVITLASILAPVLAPYPLNAPDLNALLAPPSLHHLMGTDDVGIDLFTEVLYGGRVSIAVGIFSAVVAITVGTAIGSTAGYYGGIIDGILMRLTDVALSTPVLFIILLVTALTGPHPVTVVLVIGLTAWMFPARILRSQFLTFKSRDFVEAARAMGMTDSRIIIRHILPNALPPLIVNATLLVGQAILTESTMSFLGAGLQPPNISWGYLLNQAQTYLTTAPWMAFFPGLMIFLVILSVNMVGDGLRHALDVR
ncbi:ABC transporter permease [Sulfobacillus thermosulfidooxidans]|uniref:Peptide/nickel transport system permease protein n=1 Tax=Sulfobacillus thermosulfidooxidans (strain DSM 9293 / VKM B-1269 / AT-1) TaxID=929705 RepID=A0A1W1WHW2_SULTA|nr:ABC transporter permease [Sulfobacillus thermosulfidooxidans]SMC05845.1 peptide/nickel transport system permease protein [Sulfobacillus thermosulfidooxidans DSM 9293]